MVTYLHEYEKPAADAVAPPRSLDLHAGLRANSSQALNLLLQRPPALAFPFAEALLEVHELRDPLHHPASD